MVNFFEYGVIDKVFEECKCGIIIFIVYIEYLIEVCYYLYVDCFGYVDYIKNMIIGVVFMDGVIIVVVVFDGQMFQICEYLFFVCQMGIQRIVVFVNKVDVFEDFEMLEFVEMEMCEFFILYGFDGDNIFVVFGFVFCVMEGKCFEIGEFKIDEFMKVVDEWIFIFECDIDKFFFMFIEDVFFIVGCGIVVFGCVECGIFKRDVDIEFIGKFNEIIKIKVIDIEIFKKFCEEFCVGDNFGFFFCGVCCEDIKCGMVVVKFGIVIVYKKFLFFFYVLFKEEGGCYFGFGEKYCFQMYICFVDEFVIFYFFEGIEDVFSKMVMFGDNVEMLVEFYNFVVVEVGMCIIIREGGCIVVIGFVICIFE